MIRADTDRLRIYYSLDSKTVRNRCPTWIFTNTVIQAFIGSGEVEEGAIGIEDIICVVSSLIDQVCELFPRMPVCN